MGEKSIELIMNKIAVTTVLAIFITAYIPNFLMDVNMQPWVFLPTEQMVLYYQKKKGGETTPEITLKELSVCLQNQTRAKTKQKPVLVQRK